ncbi:hypothetical protein QBE53_11505 [Vallitaleaceae bacterium 9-2]
MQIRGKTFKLTWKVTLFVCIVGLVFFIKLIGQMHESKAALTINDIHIQEEEFQMFLQDEKALTVNHFCTKYDAKYNEGFWNTDFDHETPLEYAKKNALEKLVQIKVEQKIAEEYNVLSGSTYEEIKKKIQREESAYGADGLDAFQEYMLYHSKILLKVKKRFKLTAAPVEENLLREKYEENVATYYNSPDNLKVLQIAVEELDVKNQEDIVRSLIEDIQKGTTLREIEEKYVTQGALSTKIIKYGKDESKDENTSPLEKRLKEEAYLLDTNEMSQPITHDGRQYILVCLERRQGDTVLFEEAKIFIEERIFEERFEQMVADKVDQAIVTFNPKKYNHIQMQ